MRKKIGKYVMMIFAVYYIGMLLITGIFVKDYTESETVLCEIIVSEKGDFGMVYDYPYRYELKVLERDSWVGYVNEIYSNERLEQGKRYALEIQAIENSSWFDFFIVPSIWTRYNYDICTVYNDREEFSDIDFQNGDPKEIFQTVEDESPGFFSLDLCLGH